MTIKIPTKLEQSFLDFLELSKMRAEEDFPEKFHPSELEVLKLIDKILKEKSS